MNNMVSFEKRNSEQGPSEGSGQNSQGFVISKTPENMEELRKNCEEEHEGEILPADGLYCPWTFDGWSCLNTTPAGETAMVPCPAFVYGFDKNKIGHKECTINGTWYHHPNSQEPWSNYTTCVDTGILEVHQLVNRIYVAGYSLSMVALFISLIIFIHFQSLKCTRVTIHKNLFTSFLINNLLWFSWHLFVTENSTVLSENWIICQILHVLCQYFMVSSYLWMFCEGLYLHILLVVTFLSEHRVIPTFFLLGWGTPFLLVLVYASLRGSFPSSSQLCWIDESNFLLILFMPVVISMVLNFVFLVNIVRVLVTKLRAANALPNAQSTKKAVRATLILVPLLGLHYILTPLRPSQESKFYKLYMAASAAAVSFQGLATSLLFCFLNGEVLTAFKKKWVQQSLMRRTANSGPPSSFSVFYHAYDIVKKYKRRLLWSRFEPGTSELVVQRANRSATRALIS